MLEATSSWLRTGETAQQSLIHGSNNTEARLNTRNQIDYITLNERFQNTAKNSKTIQEPITTAKRMVITMQFRLQNNNKEDTKKKRIQCKELKNRNIWNKCKEEGFGAVDTNTSRYEL